MSKEIYEFEISRNAEGGILATAGLKGDDCSYRIAGPKAWGGSKRLASIEITQRDMVEFIRSYAPGALADLAAPSVANGAADERSQFEAWLRSVWTDGYDCRRGPGGDSYASGEAQNYWTAWQAAITYTQQVAPKQALTDDQLADIWINRDCMDAILAGDIRAQIICAARATLAAAGVKP